MKSKMNIKSIIIMSVICIIALFFINSSLAANTASVNVETANLRREATSDSEIIEQLSLNNKVEILEKTGEWYRVKYNSLIGYIREDLLTVEQEENTNTLTNTISENAEVQENNTSQNEDSQNVVVENTVVNEIETNSESTNNQTEQELGKYKTLEKISLKIIPLINATDVREIKEQEQVEVLEIINGWAKVQTDTAQGWARIETLEKVVEQEATTQQDNASTTESNVETTTENTQNVATQTVQETVIKTQYVSAESVNVRKEASASSEKITVLTRNTAVDVLSQGNEWTKVKVNGQIGYISAQYLSDVKSQVTSRGSQEVRTTSTTKTTTSSSNTTTNTESTANTNTSTNTNSSTSSTSSKGAQVVAYAKQFIGTKYVYGGSSPETGFDCSGFTSYVYKHFGVSLPRTSGGQSGVGRAVSKSELQQGDLVIYSGHVAIYVGGGQVIHAPRPGKTVCIVSLDQAKPGCYQGARRIF